MKRKLTILIILLISGFLIVLSQTDKKIDNVEKIDKIIVEKANHRMFVYANGQLIKKYKISIGRNPKGDKKYEGDNKTPEGLYFIDDKNENSDYHKNLSISYPNEQDIVEAKKIGKSPGGQIKIHGIRNGLGLIGKLHLIFDWTAGCIAVTNKEIDELFEIIPIGIPIEIKP